MDIPNSLAGGTSPKCVTYSVSFCDNFVTEPNDSSRLLDGDFDVGVVDTVEVPALVVGSNVNSLPSQNICVPGRHHHVSDQFAASVPGVSTTNYRQTPGYGSLPASRAAGVEGGGVGGVLAPAAKRVIYCVHGNLMGCCMVGGDSGDLLRDREGTAASAGDDGGYGNGNGRQHQQPPHHGTSLKDAPPTVISGDHCHKSREEKIDQKARRKLIIASVLCVVFMIGEIIGGVMSSSLAIATDAAHLLTDFASFMISLFSLWVASRPPTRRMSFGWYRAEVIGALTSVLMIWVVTGVLVYLAIERIVKKDFEIDAKVMLITSAIGVFVNLVMGLTLHQHGHSHGGSHGHSHGGGSATASQETVEAAHSHVVQPSHQNINVRAAFIHVVGDFLQSFGVLVAALFIYFKPEWSIVDPICTFLFSILVIITTFAIIKDTLVVLMEGIPKGIDFAAVMETFLQIEGVIKVHNLRIWALSLDKTALAAHLAIRPGVSPQEVLTLASRNIHDRFNFFEMTLQIEEFDQNMEHCTQCKNPPES